jgi:hypothetical protein
LRNQTSQNQFYTSRINSGCSRSETKHTLIIWENWVKFMVGTIFGQTLLISWPNTVLPELPSPENYMVNTKEIIYVLIHSYKSGLNNKFKAKINCRSQKLQILPLSRIIFEWKINSTREYSNLSKPILYL